MGYCGGNCHELAIECEKRWGFVNCGNGIYE